MGCEKPKFDPRTFILVLVSLQICALYCTVWETIAASIRGDRSLMLREKDFGLFLALSSAFELLAIVAAAFIIGASAVKYFFFKKSLVLAVFAFNLIMVLPLNLSGFFLYAKSAPPNAVIDTYTANLFIKFNETMDVYMPEELLQVQEDHCCCGLVSHEEFGHKLINTTELCPTGKCKRPTYLGCGEAIPRRQRNLVLVASCIGGFCSLMMVIITPWIYAFFEKDRREARANHIRQFQLETHKKLEKKQKELQSYEMRITFSSTEKSAK